MTISRVNQLATQLKRLTDDPEPGCHTWHEAVQETILALFAEWEKPNLKAGDGPL